MPTDPASPYQSYAELIQERDAISARLLETLKQLRYAQDAELGARQGYCLLFDWEEKYYRQYRDATFEISDLKEKLSAAEIRAAQAESGADGYAGAIKENQELKEEIDSVKTRDSVLSRQVENLEWKIRNHKSWGRRL